MLTVGNYKARNGRDIRITEVKPTNGAGHRVTFPLKGYYSATSKSGRVRWVYSIWKAEGQHHVIGESGLDIIGAAE